MQRLRLQLIIVVLALVAIAALLLSQQPALQAIVVVSEPAAGGIYSEALVGTPGRFNPTLDFYNPVDRDVNSLIFSGLVRFDDRGLPVPDLADSWGISWDGTIYNFAIRQEAYWHDGQPVTSADVVFTIELLRDADYPTPPAVRELWRSVDVRLLDEKTLQFRLPAAYAPFLDHLTFGILPEHLLGDLNPEEIINDAFNLNPIGSGPYRFDSLIVEDGAIKGVVLLAFENYYQPRAFIDRFVFRYFDGVDRALEAYRRGEVQGIQSIPSDYLPEALVEPGLNLYTGRLSEMMLIYLNLDHDAVPFFQDLEVRKALYTGLNRQWMIDHLLDGQAILASGPIFPGTWAYFDGTPLVEFDPDKAISLLRAADYTIPAEGGSVRAREGVRLAFELIHPDTDLHTRLAQAIRDNWQALGMQVTLRPVPYDDLLEDFLEPRAYQAALVDLNFANTPDPDSYAFWHQTQTPGGQNYSNWNDRPASEYLEAARITVDPEERTRLYRNFQVRFAGELPALPLFYPVYTYAVDAQVRGVRMGPLYTPSDRFFNITQWFLFVEQTVEAVSTPAQ
jgi:peptide/nickel transport system substrate-binding protein